MLKLNGSGLNADKGHDLNSNRELLIAHFGSHDCEAPLSMLQKFQITLKAPLLLYAVVPLVLLYVLIAAVPVSNDNDQSKAGRCG